MLQAYLRRKLNRLSGSPPSSTLSESERDLDSTWSRAVRANEDTLTATVFSRLFYLPLPVTEQLLSKAVSRATSSAAPVPELFWPNSRARVQFWPRLRPHPDDRDKGGRKWVEPDVVIEADDRVMVIEVKWGQVQDPVGQWAVQLRAAFERYCAPNGESKSIDFLGVGGLPYPKHDATTLPEQVKGQLPAGADVRFHMLYWEDLYEEVLAILSNAEFPNEQRHVLQDIQLALEDRGLRQLLAMESLPCGRNVAISAADLFQAWSNLLPFEPLESLRPLSPSLVHLDQLSEWRIS